MDLTAKYDKKLRDALNACWAQLQSSTNLSEITRLLQEGDVSGVLATLARVEPAIYAAIGPIIEDAILESGRSVVEILPAGAVTSPIIMSLTDVGTAAFVREYVGRKIVEISDETVAAVRERVLFSVNSGRPPAATARDLREVIGLNTQGELAVRNFRKALEEDPASAIRFALRDKRYDATILKGEPLSREQIDKMVARYTAGQLRYRTESIARTEAMTAISVGQGEAIEQGVASGAIRTSRPDGTTLRKFWIATADGRTRHDHVVVPGMNKGGVGLKERFKTPLGPMAYPRDPDGTASNTVRCRCRVAYRWV